MDFLGKTLSPLGLGCWPIGGAMYAADGQSLGYTNTDDKESMRAIQAALDNGIQLFDTAAAYGAGHSEKLLGMALKNHPDAVVVTKIGFAMNEETRSLLGDDHDPANVLPAINRCLQRLGRESIDLVLLHQNSVPVEQASDLFDEMDKARLHGKIKSFGWSTDYAASVTAMANKPGFAAIEHAMHVLMDAPHVQSAAKDANVHTLIRSPLAMGLLSGKYTVDSTMPTDDIRATNQGWAKYYIDGKPNAEYTQRFDAVRELLQTGGRTPVQGALGWLWGKSATNIPVPGARTVEQVEGLAGALTFGALPETTMTEIDQLIGGIGMADGVSDR